MSASTNRAIKSSGNTGVNILKYLSVSPVVNNGFAITNVFSYKSTQIGTQLVDTSIFVRAGDATTTLNRFRVEIYHENLGYTSNDFVISPVLLPLYTIDDKSTELEFKLFAIGNVLADSSDAFEVNVYADYEGNTEPLTLGGSVGTTKLV